MIYICALVGFSKNNIKMHGTCMKIMCWAVSLLTICLPCHDAYLSRTKTLPSHLPVRARVLQDNLWKYKKGAWVWKASYRCKVSGIIYLQKKVRLLDQLSFKRISYLLWLGAWSVFFFKYSYSLCFWNQKYNMCSPQTTILLFIIHSGTCFSQPKWPSTGRWQE